MTQKQAERLVEHLKNIFMYVRVLRPDEIGDFIIDKENGKLCECYTVWNKAMPCLNCISEKALREKSQKSKLECIASNVYQVIARYVEIEGEPCVIEMIMMLGGLKKIDFDDIYQSLPVAIMLISMPVSGSIGHGIGLGLISYSVLKLCTGKGKDVSLLTYAISLLFLVKFFLVA